MNSNSLRIVSLCPSTTRTLYDLGLGECTVARTSFCEDFNNGKTPAVGGTKDPKWDEIKKLSPTHILFNLEENDHTQLSTAQEICETIVHTPVTIEESKDFVNDLALRFGAEQKAAPYISSIEHSMESLKNLKTTFTYLYFIWHPNKRVAGTGTYIDAMLQAVGVSNLAKIFSDERYPLLPENFEQHADVVLLSSEPFPYQKRHIPDYQHLGKQTLLIPGEPVCWHGTHTAKGLEFLINFVTTHIDAK